MRRLASYIALLLLTGVQPVAGYTTIDPAHKEAYGANTGWHDAGDPSHGVVIGQAYCSGYIYGANVGWIQLGDGTPLNGQAYQNNSATDFGVNHDGFGNLEGYAYGANIGWIRFEQTFGQPRVNLSTGKLTGYAWSANTGWIALDTAVAFVRTEIIDPGPDTDGDTIPDPWEYDQAGNLALLQGDGADLDGDGSPDVEEYEAGTDPLDNSDYLRIVDFWVIGSSDWITWTANPSRVYTLQVSEDLGDASPWIDAGDPIVPEAGPEISAEIVDVADTRRFYRVQADPPLAP